MELARTNVNTRKKRTSDRPTLVRIRKKCVYVWVLNLVYLKIVHLFGEPY